MNLPRFFTTVRFTKQLIATYCTRQLDSAYLEPGSTQTRAFLTGSEKLKTSGENESCFSLSELSLPKENKKKATGVEISM